MGADDYARFSAARAFLFDHRDDYDAAYGGFRWPQLETFNWALDHVDAVAADPVRGARRALWIVEPDGTEAYWTFAELSARSNRVAPVHAAAGQPGGQLVRAPGHLGEAAPRRRPVLRHQDQGRTVVPPGDRVEPVDRPVEPLPQLRPAEPGDRVGVPAAQRQQLVPARPVGLGDVHRVLPVPRRAPAGPVAGGSRTVGRPNTAWCTSL